ncbi:SMP-30/gluconolactonase/LRE family protein [Terriglobus roseus]|uniref:Gluconolactonase n=1 Tax=Terriglobus roseus TaxID=392734 RepID=A0A1G7NV12_9BACT|nr:SMP-30/gluconolactonase/LRE family protein [Terriglobus roseus]SDF77050.1 gluconolactonase [Terriglobus roseus]
MGAVSILITDPTPTIDIRCLAATGDICGEGCVWHPQQNAVFWTDINRGLLHRLEIETGGVETWRFDQPVTAVVLTNRAEFLVIILGGRIVLWDTRTHREADILFRLPDWPDVRCNDARVDPAGVLWFGTMQNNVRSDGTTMEVTEWKGALYSLASSGEITQWRLGFGISNTLAWSPNGKTMYFADTLANTIYHGHFDSAHSSLDGCDVFFRDFDRGLPDGSTMDSEGYLWNCRYGGSCIVRIGPNGSVAKIIETQVSNPTTCTFDGKGTLVFTTASNATSQIEPVKSLFAFESGVRGLPVTPFAL